MADSFSPIFDYSNFYESFLNLKSPLLQKLSKFAVYIFLIYNENDKLYKFGVQNFKISEFRGKFFMGLIYTWSLQASGNRLSQ